MEKKPKLHQALHGYAGGHIQLALSTALKPRDHKTLLALSDISGPSADIAKEGYLTGYPLLESGLFAVSRTWPAPEMPRPGCVWTHTLLIDLTDLAEMETLTGLLNLFRRPQDAKGAPEYAQPCILEAVEQASVSTLAEDWGRQMIAGLYGNSRRRIVVSHFGEGVEKTVLALWSQQWPRLRRNFRFCTFSVTDRSSDGESFDLQIVPRSNRSIRTQFPDSLDAKDYSQSSGAWIDDAIEDLLHPNCFGLRSFFRRLGADVVDGREAFRPLCQLHRTLTGSYRKPNALRNAVSILQDEFGPKQARTAWGTVANAAFAQMETLDEKSFGFLWENLRLVDSDTLINGAAQLGKLAWQRNPAILVPVLEDGSPFTIVIERTVDTLDTASLATGLAQAPALCGAILARRPEIVGQPAFWRNLDSVEEALHAAKSEHKESAALAAMLASRDDFAPHVVAAFGPKLVLKVLTTSWESVGDGNSAWLHSSVGDASIVAEFLATKSDIPKAMLYSLARILPPDAVPNDYGEDPWLTSHRHAVGTIDDSANSYMAAYFLSRALGPRSRCPGELAQLGFERTHAEAASNRLTTVSWRLLKPRLPKTSPWLRWNRCHQLRVGVADLFINRELAPGLFVNLCKDDQLFSLLSYRATKKKRGRAYLKLVRRYIVKEGNERLAARGAIIKRLLMQRLRPEKVSMPMQ